MHIHASLPRPVRCAPFVLALLLAAYSAPASAQMGEIRSTLDGVYTGEQADLGEQVFTKICSQCHNAGNPLSGRLFLSKWSNQSLYRIWDFITNRMPYGAPGSLSVEEYVGVLAFILRLNGYPSGETPLPQVFYEIGMINLDLHPDPM